MSTYRGTADRPDKAKAIAAVIAVHIALALAILSGLKMSTAHQLADSLKTFHLRELPPPPPPPPLPPSERLRPARAKEEAGAPATTALPTPVVAPLPKVVLPAKPLVIAATAPSTGSGPTVGTATGGVGTGAGGSGNGPGGGGGYADYSRFTPARKLTKIPDREYRRIAASGIRRGSIAITILVTPDGTPSNCRVARSSGSGYVDSLMCQLTVEYVRFSPALDAQGRPIAQDVTWAPDWSPNRW